MYLRHAIALCGIAIGCVSAVSIASLPIVPGGAHPAGVLPGGPVHSRSAVYPLGECLDAEGKRGTTDIYNLLRAPTCINHNTVAVTNSVMFTQVIFLGDGWLASTPDLEKAENLVEFMGGWDGSAYSLLLNEYGPLSPLIYPEGFEAGDAPPTLPSTYSPLPMVLGYYQSYYTTTPDAQVAADPSSAALNEICSGLASGKYKTAPNGATQFFMVYASSPIPQGGPDEHGAACGIHTYTGCPGSEQLFAYGLVYNADTDTGDCDPQDTVTGHSMALASEANTSARIIADTFTDEGFQGWFDLVGSEVADKCPWQFDQDYTVFTNGTRWKLQDLWSDLAYNRGSGIPNYVGKKGCVTPQHP